MTQASDCQGGFVAAHAPAHCTWRGRHTNPPTGDDSCVVAKVSAYERLQIESLLQSTAPPIEPGSGLAVFSNASHVGRKVYDAAIAPAMLPWLADRPQAKLAPMPNAILVFAISNLRSLAQAAAAPIEPYQVW